jgi:hypothetical protein
MRKFCARGAALATWNVRESSEPSVPRGAKVRAHVRRKRCSPRLDMKALSFPVFVWRVTATHMLTYFVAGLAALTLFDYASLYATTDLRLLMRPTDSPWVAAGPALQVIRGTMFGVVLWPLAERITSGWRGGLELFGLVVGLAVFGAAGPAPGSLEGFLFTTVPPEVQLLGLPEVVVQTAAFSLLLSWWCRKPARWLDVAAGIGIALVLVVSVLGVLAATGVIDAR